MAESEQSKGRKIPAAEPIDLANMVDYAQGSIVSRTLMEKDMGTLTLFAFDAGQSLSEHTAPFDALVHILDGQAELTIAGKTIEARCGQIVLMPADIPHALKANSRFKMLLTMLRSR